MTAPVNTTQHEYDTTQHETTRVQHETTRVKHDTNEYNTTKNLFFFVYVIAAYLEPGILGSRALFNF